MNATTKRGAAFALGSALLYGLTTPLTAALTTQLGTFELAAALYLGAALLLVVHRGKVVAQERLWLVASALIGGVAGPVLFVAGLRSVDAATASLLLAAQPVLAAVIAWTIVREHASRRTVIGMLAIAVGAAILAWRGSPHGSAGALLVLGAATAWAVDDNLGRRFAASDVLTLAALKGGIAGGCSLVIAALVREYALAVTPFAAALAVGLIGYGVSVAWFVRAQRELGTARTAAYFGAAPLIGAAASFGFGARPNSIAFTASAVLIAAGIVLHATERHRHAHRHQPLVHDHEHVHDAHHHHAHTAADPAGEPHQHLHRHARFSHAHSHTPDLHHRHAHQHE